MLRNYCRCRSRDFNACQSVQKITVFDAKLDSVSHTIWGTITFMLNGMVFFLWEQNFQPSSPSTA